jgi:hypothetical protein
LVAAWNHAADPSFCSAFDPIDNQRQRHGSPKPLKDTMHTLPYTKPAKMLSQPLPNNQLRKSISTKSVSTWQPQQSSLTREEIRAIVLDQIG